MSKELNAQIFKIIFENEIKDHIINRNIQMLTERRRIPPQPPQPPIAPPGPPGPPNQMIPGQGNPGLPFHPKWNQQGYQTPRPGFGTNPTGQNPSRPNNPNPLPTSPDFPGWPANGGNNWWDVEDDVREDGSIPYPWWPPNLWAQPTPNYTPTFHGIA